MLLFPFLITQVLNEAYMIFFLENFNSVCLIIRENIGTVIIKLIPMYYRYVSKVKLKRLCRNVLPEEKKNT